MQFTSSRFCLAALAISAILPAFAAAPLDHNRFKWRDAAGNLHYSDSLPAEASRLGYEVVNPQGIIVKRVERAKTPEELAAAKVEAAKAEAQQAEVATRARADDQLLSYPAESDLQRAQGQQLEMLNQQVVTAQISLRSQEQALADLLGRAADVERAGNALPAQQARELAEMRKQVDNQRLAVERRASERDGAGKRFEQEIARYRELKARIAERHSQ